MKIQFPTLKKSKYKSLEALVFGVLLFPTIGCELDLSKRDVQDSSSPSSYLKLNGGDLVQCCSCLDQNNCWAGGVEPIKSLGYHNYSAYNACISSHYAKVYAKCSSGAGCSGLCALDSKDLYVQWDYGNYSNGNYY